MCERSRVRSPTRPKLTLHFCAFLSPFSRCFSGKCSFLFFFLEVIRFYFADILADPWFLRILMEIPRDSPSLINFRSKSESIQRKPENDQIHPPFRLEDLISLKLIIALHSTNSSLLRASYRWADALSCKTALKGDHCATKRSSNTFTSSLALGEFYRSKQQDFPTLWPAWDTFLSPSTTSNPHIHDVISELCLLFSELASSIIKKYLSLIFTRLSPPLRSWRQ